MVEGQIRWPDRDRRNQARLSDAQAEMELQQYTEAAARKERSAALVVRKLVQRLRAAPRDKREELMSQIHEALAEHWSDMGSLACAVEDEATAALHKYIVEADEAEMNAIHGPLDIEDTPSRQALDALQEALRKTLTATRANWREASLRVERTWRQHEAHLDAESHALMGAEVGASLRDLVRRLDVHPPLAAWLGPEPDPERIRRAVPRPGSGPRRQMRREEGNTRAEIPATERSDTPRRAGARAGPSPGRPVAGQKRSNAELAATAGDAAAAASTAKVRKSILCFRRSGASNYVDLANDMQRMFGEEVENVSASTACVLAEEMERATAQVFDRVRGEIESASAVRPETPAGGGDKEDGAA